MRLPPRANSLRTMSTAIFLLLAFQAGPAPRVQRDASATINIPAFMEESPADAAAYEERQFISRLNGLATALIAFNETYRSGKVDLKKVKALRKAMHELEKSEWFRSSKTK